MFRRPYLGVFRVIGACRTSNSPRAAPAEGESGRREAPVLFDLLEDRAGVDVSEALRWKGRVIGQRTGGDAMPEP